MAVRTNSRQRIGTKRAKRTPLDCYRINEKSKMKNVRNIIVRTALSMSCPYIRSNRFAN